MKFLHTILGKLPEFQELERAVGAGTLPAAVTGLSTVHKAHFIASLCVRRKKKAFVVTGEEAEAQRLCEDLRAMGLRPL